MGISTQGTAPDPMFPAQGTWLADKDEATAGVCTRIKERRRDESDRMPLEHSLESMARRWSSGDSVNNLRRPMPAPFWVRGMAWIGLGVACVTCLGVRELGLRRMPTSFLLNSRFPSVEINKLAFNPPGPDTGRDSSLNQEVIVLKNLTGRTKVMDGWRIVDRGRDNTYVFENYSLEPGTKVRIHTGAGTDTHRDLYWGLNHHVWNNGGGEAARLLASDGDMVDRCAYEDGVESPLSC